MKAEFWLKVAAKKFTGLRERWEMAGVPKTSAKKPATDENEIVVKMVVEIPDALFEEPQLNINVTIPEPKTTPVLTAEVKRGVADVLAERLGVKVHLSAEPALTRSPKSKGFVESLEEI